MLAFVFFPPIIAERYSYTNIYLNSDFGGKDILILRENTILYLTSIKVNGFCQLLFLILMIENTVKIGKGNFRTCLLLKTQEFLYMQIRTSICKYHQKML